LHLVGYIYIGIILAHPILHINRIRVKAVFCIYAGDKVATVGNMLVVSSKETGLEVNADKTRYMVNSRDQNAGQSYNIKIDNNIASPKEWKSSSIWVQT
jgi:hypothetical protein